MKKVLLALLISAIFANSVQAANISNLVIDNDVTGNPWYSCSPSSRWTLDQLIGSSYGGTSRSTDSGNTSYSSIWYTTFSENTISYIGADIYLKWVGYNDPEAQYRMYYTDSDRNIVFVDDQILNQATAASGYTYDLFDEYVSDNTFKNGGVGVHLYPGSEDGYLTGADAVRINVVN